MPRLFIIIILNLQFAIAANQFLNLFAAADFLNHPILLLMHCSHLSIDHFNFKVRHFSNSNY